MFNAVAAFLPFFESGVPAALIAAAESSTVAMVSSRPATMMPWASAAVVALASSVSMAWKSSLKSLSAGHTFFAHCLGGTVLDGRAAPPALATRPIVMRLAAVSIVSRRREAVRSIENCPFVSRIEGA